MLVTVFPLRCHGRTIRLVLGMRLRSRLGGYPDDSENHDQQDEQAMQSRFTHTHSLTGASRLGNVVRLKFHSS